MDELEKEKHDEGLVNFRNYIANIRATEGLPPLSEETVLECFNILEEFHSNVRRIK
jgi:hypothetical protein